MKPENGEVRYLGKPPETSPRKYSSQHLTDISLKQALEESYRASTQANIESLHAAAGRLLGQAIRLEAEAHIMELSEAKRRTEHKTRSSHN